MHGHHSGLRAGYSASLHSLSHALHAVPWPCTRSPCTHPLQAAPWVSNTYSTGTIKYKGEAGWYDWQWCPGEPNSPNGGEPCVVLSTGCGLDNSLARFNDVACGGMRPVLCSKDNGCRRCHSCMLLS